MRRKFNVEQIKKAAELLGGRIQFAQKVDMSYVTVSDWINGRKTPSPESCIKIEKATEGKVRAKDILIPYFLDEEKKVA